MKYSTNKDKLLGKGISLMKRFITGFILFLLLTTIASISCYLINNSSIQVSTTPNASVVGDPITTSIIEDNYIITIYLTDTDEILELDFEAYIANLLAIEMPSTYHPEALKAQAIVLRSYILNKIAEYMESGIPDSHHGALMCNNPLHCYAWQNSNSSSALSAVKETRGKYLIYDGKVAKTPFHQLSNGRTENAVDVWGVNFPYLISVDSSFDIRADGYRSRVFYPKEAFFTVFKGLRPHISMPDDLSTITNSITYNNSGSVAKIQILDNIFTGTEIQEAFGLRSPTFSMTFSKEQVIFDVKGYGHGIGMSKFGANTMANQNNSYLDIINHYYNELTMAQLYHKL